MRISTITASKKIMTIVCSTSSFEHLIDKNFSDSPLNQSRQTNSKCKRSVCKMCQQCRKMAID